MRIAIVLVLILITGTLTANFAIKETKTHQIVNGHIFTRTQTVSSEPRARIVAAAANVANFVIVANIEGWNGTTGCTSGTPNCNPAITEFRGVTFSAQVNWGDCCTHDFAIYTGGFPAAGVSPTNPCSTSSTNGCLVTSSNVFQSTTSISFTPAIPKDDFTGLGTYEYYCQFHPGSMHGRFTLYKSPDLDKNGVVNIIDVATVAFSFGATPTSPNWNAAADLDNNGVVNIIDVAVDAFYFGQTI